MRKTILILAGLGLPACSTPSGDAPVLELRGTVDTGCRDLHARRDAARRAVETLSRHQYGYSTSDDFGVFALSFPGPSRAARDADIAAANAELSAAESAIRRKRC